MREPMLDLIGFALTAGVVTALVFLARVDLVWYVKAASALNLWLAGWFSLNLQFGGSVAHGSELYFSRLRVLTRVRPKS
jgi:hypothetical protein